ncbi:MAG: hypothetical protein ACI35O_08215 [Bacillaceae bacterium]
MKDIVLLILAILLTISVIWNNRAKLQGLSKFQLVMVAMIYVLTVAVVFVSVYYGVNWLAGYISNGIISYIVKFISVGIILVLCAITMNKLIEKVTKRDFTSM